MNQETTLPDNTLPNNMNHDGEDTINGGITITHQNYNGSEEPRQSPDSIRGRKRSANEIDEDEDYTEEEEELEEPLKKKVKEIEQEIEQDSLMEVRPCAVLSANQQYQVLSHNDETVDSFVVSELIINENFPRNDDDDDDFATNDETNNEETSEEELFPGINLFSSVMDGMFEQRCTPNHDDDTEELTDNSSSLPTTHCEDTILDNLFGDYEDDFPEVDLTEYHNSENHSTSTGNLPTVATYVLDDQATNPNEDSVFDISW